jgi:hypothetical protein
LQNERCHSEFVVRFGGLLVITFILFTQASRAQTTASLSADTIRHRDSVHTPIVKAFRRPLSITSGPNTTITNEAVRYYGSPQTLPALIEESVTGTGLLLDDQGYGREAFLSTSRYNEPFVATFINAVLPLNDPITGNSILNYYPVELASNIELMHGGEFGSLDHGSSDAVNLKLETFRTPIAYSRFHFTQELSHSLSNFEGLFSFNTSEATNFVFSIYRRGSGNALSASTLNLNPRTDDWWIRTQANYDTKSVHALFFLLYTSAFSGINGGTFKVDSATNVFDEQLAPVKYSQSYDHRTRLDLLAQSAFSLLSEKDPTQLAAFATVSARSLHIGDTNFPPMTPALRNGDRFGFSFIQPAAVSLGEFSTRAQARADAQVLSRTTPDSVQTDFIEKRYSALVSDSIALGGAYGISANGFFRWTVSQLTLDKLSQPNLALTNFGLEGSARLSRILTVTANLNYARDRAVQSPDPTATYELKNFGAFASLAIPLGKFDSISIVAGLLDRTEPEGIVLKPLDANDSLLSPTFSSAAIHTRGINGSLQLWFDKFRLSAQAEYLPSIHPVSTYANLSVLQSDLNKRIFGAAGFYYENDIAEGNLRLSLGARVRYYNSLTPALTYDPASDYYVYRGLPRFAIDILNDWRLTTPAYPIDILASALIDQRAQINVQFLNILGTPYFNTMIYPREGFTFRLDVTWAFLD